MIVLSDEDQQLVNWMMELMLKSLREAGSDGLPYWAMFPPFRDHIGLDETLYEWVLAILVRDNKVTVQDGILYYQKPQRKEILH